ncbi:MAG: hypothetical protein ABI261_07300 [Ginsengibacter sp.]
MKGLSKDEMKNVLGGRLANACSMTYQDSSGGWHTEQGSCSDYIVYGGYIPFCQTASFSTPVSLSSNGGVSSCGSSVFSG